MNRSFLERISKWISQIVGFSNKTKPTVKTHVAKDRINLIAERNQVELYGVLRSVTYPPATGTDSFSAALFDGTGTIDLVWLGRSSIPGVTPGTHLQVSGIVSAFQGNLSILNPEYQIMPER